MADYAVSRYGRIAFDISDHKGSAIVVNAVANSRLMFLSSKHAAEVVRGTAKEIADEKRALYATREGARHLAHRIASLLNEYGA